MTGIIATIAIVALIGLSVLAIYIVQRREKAKLERLHKIASLTKFHDKLQSLLHELPGQFVHLELRKLIATKSFTAIKQLHELKASKSIQGKLEADEAYLKQVQSSEFQAPQGKLENENALNAQLSVLSKFVQSQARAKKIAPQQAQEYLQNIDLQIAQARAKAFANKAAQALEQDKARVAIHAYHNAIEAFDKVAEHPDAAVQLQHYREEIKRIESEAGQADQAIKEKAAASNNQWDDYLDEGDDWKKKNDYD